jgi:hypothetical protein
MEWSGSSLTSSHLQSLQVNRKSYQFYRRGALLSKTLTSHPRLFLLVAGTLLNAVVGVGGIIVARPLDVYDFEYSVVRILLSFGLLFGPLVLFSPSILFRDAHAYSFE